MLTPVRISVLTLHASALLPWLCSCIQATLLVLAKYTQSGFLPACMCHVCHQSLFLCAKPVLTTGVHACVAINEIHVLLLQVLGTDMKKHFDIVSRFQVELMQPLSPQCRSQQSSPIYLCHKLTSEIAGLYLASMTAHRQSELDAFVQKVGLICLNPHLS